MKGPGIFRGSSAPRSGASDSTASSAAQGFRSLFAPEVSSRATTAAGLNFAAPPSAFNPDFSALLQEDTPLRARDQPGTLDSALYMVKQALGEGATFTADTSPISLNIYAGTGCKGAHHRSRYSPFRHWLKAHPRITVR